jgi:hypothetical protein
VPKQRLLLAAPNAALLYCLLPQYQPVSEASCAFSSAGTIALASVSLLLAAPNAAWKLGRSFILKQAASQAQ